MDGKAKHRRPYRIIEGHRWHTFRRAPRPDGEIDVYQRCPRCEAERQLVIRAGVGYLVGDEPIETCASRWQRLGREERAVSALAVEGAE